MKSFVVWPGAFGFFFCPAFFGTKIDHFLLDNYSYIYICTILMYIIYTVSFLMCFCPCLLLNMYYVYLKCKMAPIDISMVISLISDPYMGLT